MEPVTARRVTLGHASLETSGATGSVGVALALASLAGRRSHVSLPPFL